MKKYYAAYGSNLNIKKINYRCENAKKIGTSFLNNYRLAYRGIEDGDAYLTIEEAEGYFVPIGIYEITSSDEESLDKFEGYPDFYHKEYLKVNISGNDVTAIIYIMNDIYNYNLPSDYYVHITRVGYEDYGFNKNILHEAYKYTMEKVKRGR